MDDKLKSLPNQKTQVELKARTCLHLIGYYWIGIFISKVDATMKFILKEMTFHLLFANGHPIEVASIKL
jgi:hypothetical protein